MGDTHMARDIEEIKTADSPCEERALTLLKERSDEAFSTSELSDLTGCSPSTIRKLMDRHEHEGNIDSRKVPEESNTRYYWWDGGGDAD